MKVANIVLAFKDPPQLDRMIKSLAHPEFDFFIHLDRNSALSRFSHLTKNTRTFFLDKRISWHWGSYSFIRAVINAFDQILLSTIDYDYVNLLSNSDYPIRPVTEFIEFLKVNNGKSFISFEKQPSPWWDHAIGRINRYHLTDFSFKGKTRVEQLLKTLINKRTFPFPYELYGGPMASYWTISREAAIYLQKFFKKNDKQIRFFKYTWAPDEFLFTTILMNSPLGEKMVNDNLRFIDWEIGKSNPNVLTGKDFDRIIKSGKYFGRKFDIQVDQDILDQLDFYILKKEIELYKTA